MSCTYHYHFIYIYIYTYKCSLLGYSLEKQNGYQCKDKNTIKKQRQNKQAQGKLNLTRKTEKKNGNSIKTRLKKNNLNDKPHPPKAPKQVLSTNHPAKGPRSIPSDALRHRFQITGLLQTPSRCRFLLVVREPLQHASARFKQPLCRLHRESRSKGNAVQHNRCK